jgi:TolA-binding protein
MLSSFFMIDRLTRTALPVLLLVSVSAHAALFDDEEARKRIEATNQRLAQIQKQFDDRIAALESQLKSQGLIELFNQVELLKAEAARLRGQIEVLTYELAEAQKRQRDLYVDLDSRMRRMETAPVAAPAVAAAPSQPVPVPAPLPTGAAPAGAPPSPTFGPPPPIPAPTAGPTTIIVPGRTVPVPAPGDVGAEQRSYDAALDLFKSGNYGGAVASFAAFVKAYPRSPLAPSAQYWLGNAQFAQ